MRTGDRQLIKELNMAIVVDAIRRHQPISRVEVARRTHLSPATVTGMVQQLVRGGWVEEAGNRVAARGRRPVLLRLNSQAFYCLALKIAPGQITAGVADLGARILGTVSARLPSGASGVLDVVEQCAAAVLEQVGIGRDLLVGVGVALPGIVDAATGESQDAHLLGWTRLPLFDLLREHFRLPVFIENDANALTLAERWYGAGCDRTNLVAVTVGIGIGAGIIVNDQIYRGALGGAGELGHTTVDPEGPECSCGRLGCLEAMAGDRWIAAEARAAMSAGQAGLLTDMVAGDPQKVTRETVVDAALRGDTAARGIVETAARRIGISLANVVNILNPEVLIVGGELAEQAGALVLDPIRQVVRERSFSVLARDLEVLPAALGNQGWLVGAAALVLREVFRLPVTAQSGARSAISVSRLIADRLP